MLVCRFLISGGGGIFPGFAYWGISFRFFQVLLIGGYLFRFRLSGCIFHFPGSAYWGDIFSGLAYWAGVYFSRFCLLGGCRFQVLLIGGGCIFSDFAYRGVSFQAALVWGAPCQVVLIRGCFFKFCFSGGRGGGLSRFCLLGGGLSSLLIGVYLSRFSLSGVSFQVSFTFQVLLIWWVSFRFNAYRKGIFHFPGSAY